jgi:hypothetical protein
LPEILDWAQTADLTEVPNPSYRRTKVKVNRSLSQRLLESMGVSAEAAKTWGATLREAVSTAVKEFEACNNESRNGQTSPVSI